MYLHEAEAGAVVAAMLRHAKLVIGLSGPADHVTDNGELDQGWAREEDDAFIHNFDAMVSRAGGTVIMHRWEGPRLVDGNTVYFIFAKMD